MIDHLFIHGCSHTAAVELPSWEDNDQGLPRKDANPREIGQHCYNDSWANQVGVKLDIKKIINYAVPGSSNDYIIEETIRYVSKLSIEQREKLFVIIGWTGADRLFLKSDEPGEQRWGGYYMFIPGLIGAKKSKNIQLMKPRHESMYRELLRTEWGSWRAIQYRLLLSHFTLQSFLEKMGVKYLFVNMLQEFELPIIKLKRKTLGLYESLDLKRVYKGGTGDGCYFERFRRDPNTEWALNHHVAKSGQDKFANEVYDYIRVNDLLLRKK